MAGKIAAEVYAATEPHRHMCEVVHVTRLSLQDREAYLERVEGFRGRELARLLREEVNAMLDEARRAP